MFPVGSDVLATAGAVMFGVAIGTYLAVGTWLQRLIVLITAFRRVASHGLDVHDGCL